MSEIIQPQEKTNSIDTLDDIVDKKRLLIFDMDGTLLDSMECDEVTPSLSQAKRLRRFSEDHTLTDNDIMDIMSEIKGNQKEYVRVPTDSIRKYFNRDTTVKQMEQTIVKAMEYYNRYLERQRNDRGAR